jgi:hypothetical protein
MGPACKCIAGESETKFARGNALWVPHVSVGRIPVRPGLSLSLLVSFLANPRSSSLVAIAAPSSIPFTTARCSSPRRRSAPAHREGGAPQHSGHCREGGAPFGEAAAPRRRRRHVHASRLWSSIHLRTRGKFEWNQPFVVCLLLNSTC